MHHCGVVIRSVGSSAKPSHTPLESQALGDREGPVHGVELRVPVHPAVVADVQHRKETYVGGDVPFLLLL